VKTSVERSLSHDSDFGIYGTKGKIIWLVSHSHAEDCFGQMRDDTKNIAGIVVEETYLVSSSACCHYNVSFVVEIAWVNEWRRMLSVKLFLFLLFLRELRVRIFFVFLYVVLVLFLHIFVDWHLCFGSVPFDVSCLFEGSEIKELKDVLLSVWSSKESKRVVLEVDCFTADVRAVNTCNRSSLSNVV